MRHLKSVNFGANRVSGRVYYISERRKKEEGRRKREEGRGKKEEGRRKSALLLYFSASIFTPLLPA
jgi:hypothetical protein